MDKKFWEKLERIYKESQIIIDRPKGTAHPRFPQFIYPLDYGYLKNTVSGDGNEIDLWLGSKPEKELEYIICTVDVLKRDVEIKLLCGCTEEEKNIILEFHNNSEYMSGICIERHPAQ